MMDKPIFVDYETKICSAYLNAVAATVWDALGQATNPQEARQFIGAVEEAPQNGSSYARQNAQWVQIQVVHNDLTGRSAPDAHPVSAITGLQASLDQINLDLSGKAPASAGTAAGTSFSPTGSIAATNVQSALAEVDGDVVANTGAIVALNNSLNLLDAAAVKKSSLTGAAFIPAGTTAQRDTAQLGAFRYNTQTNTFEGLSSAGWGQVGGGGGQMYGNAAVKAIFYNAQSIAENIDVLAGQNGLSAGPVTVENGFTVTVANGSTWTVV